MMPIEFNITAALFLGMVILLMVSAEFPYMRYTHHKLYHTIQILLVAIAVSSIAYISIFIL